MTLRKVLGTAAAVAVLAASLPGQVIADNHHAATRSLSVSGSGEAAGAPDQAQINAGVQTTAKTVAGASRQNQAIVERIMVALAKEGIEPDDIQTSNYSIWPEQRNHPQNDGEITITGYRVNNTVNVTINDIENVGEVLAAVTNAGANTIHGVNFGVKDTAELEQRARAAAMQDARSRAEALAELAGVELGQVQTISMSSGGGMPIPMMSANRFALSEAAPAPGISPGQLSVSVQLQVSYSIQ